jgi:integrase
MRRVEGVRIYGPYKHRDRWRCHLTDRNGKVRYRSFATRTAAERYVAAARDEAQGRTVRQGVSAFIESLANRGRAPLTMRAAEDRLWLLLGLPANAERPLRWVLGRGAELYQAAQVGKAPDTHRNALSQGKAWGVWCVRQAWLRDNPFAEVEPVGRKRRGAEKPALRIDEARKLAAKCNEHPTDQAAVAVLATLLLGVRASELVNRNVRDLDDGGRLLWISASKTEAGRRMLRVPESLQPLLLQVAGSRPGNEPLFRELDGKRPTRSWLAYHTRRLCDLAGVPVLNPHALRRTHATLATNAGATGDLVAAQLGHTSPAITHAAYVQPDAARAAQGDRALRVIAGGMR